MGDPDSQNNGCVVKLIKEENDLAKRGHHGGSSNDRFEEEVQAVWGFG